MQNNTFTDLHMSLIRHPASYDLVKKYDLDAIKTAVRNILNTSKGEKLFNPKFGADLNGLLFELQTVAARIVTKKKIVEEIETWEPRVLITDVYFKNYEDSFGVVEIGVSFVLREDTNIKDTVKINMRRVR